MKLITLVRKWLSNQAVIFWVGYTAGVIAVKTEYWWDLFHSSVILVLVFSGLATYYRARVRLEGTGGVQ